MNYTLNRLKGVLPENRGAVFETVAALVSPSGKEWVFSGQLRGTLLESPRVPCQPDMPYSALFQPEGQKKVWAEMSVEEENNISHRGKAFAKVRSFLKEVLEK